MVEYGSRTIINVQHQKLLTIAKGMYYVDLKIFGSFLDLPNVSLVVLIAIACSHVFGKINIKIVDNVGESSKLCEQILIRND